MRLVGLFSDGSGTMEVVWFQRVKSLRELYHTHTEYTLFGKPSVFNGRWSMVHPEIDPPGAPLASGGFRGVYPLTEQLRNRGFVAHICHSRRRDSCRCALHTRDTARTYSKPLWASGLAHGSHRHTHSPSMAMLYRARLRLKFEELFYLQLDIQRYARRRSSSTQGFMFGHIGQFSTILQPVSSLSTYGRAETCHKGDTRRYGDGTPDEPSPAGRCGQRQDSRSPCLQCL